MLNKQGFDLWANEYDHTVQVSEDNNLYPFAGYKKIMNTIFNEVMQKKQSKVLDGIKLATARSAIIVACGFVGSISSTSCCSTAVPYRWGCSAR